MIYELRTLLTLLFVKIHHSISLRISSSIELFELFTNTMITSIVIAFTQSEKRAIQDAIRSKSEYMLKDQVIPTWPSLCIHITMDNNNQAVVVNFYGLELIKIYHPQNTFILISTFSVPTSTENQVPSRDFLVHAFNSLLETLELPYVVHLQLKFTEDISELAQTSGEITSDQVAKSREAKPTQSFKTGATTPENQHSTTTTSEQDDTESSVVEDKMELVLFDKNKFQVSQYQFNESIPLAEHLQSSYLTAPSLLPQEPAEHSESSLVPTESLSSTFNEVAQAS